MRIGLVIQGPIRGGGLTGKTYGAGKTSAPTANFAPFNALDNVLSNLQGASKFAHIVVSTWESEPTGDLDLIISRSPRFSLIRNQDPTPKPAKIRKPVAGIPFLHEANKVRMFYSTRMGIQELLQHDIDHAIKIRTDQTMNLELLYDEFENFVAKGMKKIFVPSLREKSPWVVTDFYFGGEINLIRSICKFVENTKQEFHDDLHKDFFFKTHFLVKGIYGDNLWSDFFINTNTDPISPKTDQIVKESIAEIWEAGSQDLYKSIVWRGEQIKYIQADSYFSDANRDFNFNYSLGRSHDNLNYDQVMRTVFGRISLPILVKRYFLFLSIRKVRRIRNRISAFRDKLGLRL